MIKDRFLRANCRESGIYRGYPIYSVSSASKIDLTVSENYVNIIFVFPTGVVGLNGYTIGFVQDGRINLNEDYFALAQKGAAKEKVNKTIEEETEKINKTIAEEKVIQTIEYLTADEILNNVWNK